MQKKDLISLADLTREEVFEILDTAKALKLERKAGVRHTMLQGRTLAMVFQKPSLRTRVSFEVAMKELGGHALYIGPEEIQLGKRETVEDAALVLSRYVDGIMARVFAHQDLLDLARHASVPVINGLSDLLHPCQALADLLTVWEKKRTFESLTLCFIGDGNNVAHSLINGCAKVGMAFRIACPEGHEPNDQIVKAARSAGGRIQMLRDPVEAATGADVLYTDTWTSMGQEAEVEKRRRAFKGFTIDDRLLQAAANDALVLHCLPAHYGEEITYEASRSAGSAIFDQAENRLHAQKAVLALLLA